MWIGRVGCNRNTAGAHLDGAKIIVRRLGVVAFGTKARVVTQFAWHHAMDLDEPGQTVRRAFATQVGFGKPAPCRVGMEAQHRKFNSHQTFFILLASSRA